MTDFDTDAGAESPAPLSRPAPSPTGDPIPHELEALPEPVLETPATRDPSLLPLRRLTWVNFERLCVRFARHVDGLQGVRFYGRGGQKQHGLDLVGMTPSGEYVVYQARDIDQLTGPRLKKAVDDYMTSGRRFGARRFVLAVACEVLETKVDDELADARKRYPDLEIELYDAERITDLLRGQREIVEQFFTTAWADIFCPGEHGGAVRTRPVRQIDQLLHGPLAALGFADDLDRAHALRERQPADAAKIYEQLVTALDRHNYQAHASAMRREQAAALEEAGDRAAAFCQWHRLALGQFERGDLLGTSLSNLERLANGDALLTLTYHALAAADAWFDHPDAIDALAEAVVGLDPLDVAEATRATVWLAEFAVVDRRFDLLREHEAMLCRLAEPADALRLRLAVAEVADGSRWAEIGQEGLTRKHSGPLSALCCMRAGRRAMWHADPETANDAYRRAVELTTEAGLLGDAQTSLRATIGVEIRFGVPDYQMVQDTLNIANALPAEPTLIEGRSEARTAALRELNDGNVPNAHRALRRLIYLAVISGDIQLEIDGRKRLGRLYQSIGMVDLALVNHILVGDDKAALDGARLASPIDPDDWIDNPAPWVRAAGWAAIQAQADTLADAKVDATATKAIRDAAGIAQSSSGAQVFVHAMGALTALAARLSTARAEEALDATEPWIDRQTGTYRFTDDAMVALFVVVHNTQPGLQGRAADAILRSLDLLSDQQRIANLIMHSDALSDELVAGLITRSESGSDTAVDVLAYFDVDHPKVRERAERQARDILAMTIDPGRSSWGMGSGYSLHQGHAARLTARRRGDVARKLVDLAEDASDLAVSRAQALEALDAIAESLSVRQRANLFPRVTALASDDPQLNAIDQSNAMTLHPLSRHRLDLGADSLRPAALRCAASLATTRARARQCQALATRVVQSDQQQLVLAAVIALVRTVDKSPIDPGPLLVDPRAPVRRAGIAIWAQNPSALGDVPDMTIDADRSVRFELAAHLDELDSNGAVGVPTLRRRLAADPSAIVRSRARKS